MGLYHQLDQAILQGTNLFKDDESLFDKRIKDSWRLKVMLNVATTVFKTYSKKRGYKDFDVDDAFKDVYLLFAQHGDFVRTFNAQKDPKRDPKAFRNNFIAYATNSYVRLWGRKNSANYHTGVSLPGFALENSCKASKDQILTRGTQIVEEGLSSLNDTDVDESDFSLKVPSDNKERFVEVAPVLSSSIFCGVRISDFLEHGVKTPKGRRSLLYFKNHLKPIYEREIEQLEAELSIHVDFNLDDIFSQNLVDLQPDSSPVDPIQAVSVLDGEISDKALSKLKKSLKHVLDK